MKASEFLTLNYADGFIVLNEPAYSIPGRLAERLEGQWRLHSPKLIAENIGRTAMGEQPIHRIGPV